MNTILIVDDEPSIRMLTSRLLQRAGYSVLEAQDGAHALEMVAEHEPHLVVLDLSMPNMSGLEVCRHLKDNPFTARIPILMLTAQSSMDFKLQGFDAGADDYLGKPFDPRELVARVGALLRLVRRESESNPSSGLPGGQAIASELERRAQAQVPFAVCYFDIDRFKPFADAWGFIMADDVITGTGQALRNAARGIGAFVGHIGGDDFIGITSPENASSFAQDVAERFNTKVTELLFHAPQGREAVARGTYMGVDRAGITTDIALVGLSSIIIEVEPGRWVSPVHLGTFAASLKRDVKARGAGVIAGTLV